MKKKKRKVSAKSVHNTLNRNLESLAGGRDDAKTAIKNHETEVVLKAYHDGEKFLSADESKCLGKKVKRTPAALSIVPWKMAVNYYRPFVCNYEGYEPLAGRYRTKHAFTHTDYELFSSATGKVGRANHNYDFNLIATRVAKLTFRDKNEVVTEMRRLLEESTKDTFFGPHSPSTTPDLKVLHKVAKKLAKKLGEVT